MFEAQRAQLREWLVSQLADNDESGELYGEFADRILTHVWWVLEPAIDDRLADEREATWDSAREAFSED